MDPATTTAIPPQPEATFADQPRGAYYHAVHTVRKVKIYPMTESELQNIRLLSSIATLFLTIATAAGGFAASIWWDVATSGNQAVRTMGDPILKVLGAVIAFSLVLAVVAFWKRWDSLTKILEAASEANV
jgi:hypothetical protein